MRRIVGSTSRWIAVGALLLWAGCGALPARRSALGAGIRAQPAPAQPERRSLYVGTFEERDAALELAAAHGIGELTLYGLGGPLREGTALAAFIPAAHARGVEVVAPVSGMDRVEALVAWERDHPDARFDGWVTEFEYWNAEGDERGTRFAEMQAMLTAMRASKGEGWVACYLGYPTAEEGAWIAANVDRVYLSVAVADPADALTWGQGTRSHQARHSYFAGRVPIWPIVYARGDAHMRPWLQQHSIGELETTLRRALNGQLDGVGYFDFGSIQELF